MSDNTNTINDFAENTYWFTTSGAGDSYRYKFVTDINNPKQLFRDVELFPAQFYDRDWIAWKQSVAKDTETIDLTLRDQDLKVTKIKWLGDRNYVVTFQTAGWRTYDYVVQDCNHYEHAFNRFRKRVQTQIGPSLGLDLRVKDARVKEQPKVNTRPLRPGAAFYAFDKWTDAATSQYACTDPDCATCNDNWQRYQESLAKPTVEKVVQLVETIVASKPVEKPVYSLWLMVNFKAPVEVGGDSDVFALINRAKCIVQGFDGVTPNVSVHVRDDKGWIKAEVTLEKGVVTF